MAGEQQPLFGNSGRDDLATPVLADWIGECRALRGYWYVKRLSANDTGATGSHQAGLYLPKDVAFKIVPELNASDAQNPDTNIDVVSGCDTHEATCRVIWYREGTRDETRITRWGGRASAVTSHENTGAVGLFFFTDADGERLCRYWVCRDELDEDVAETFAGPVEPGSHRFWAADGSLAAEMWADTEADPCWIDADQIPEGWLKKFPSTLEIFHKALELAPPQRPTYRRTAAGAARVRILRFSERGIPRTVAHDRGRVPDYQRLSG